MEKPAVKSFMIGTLVGGAIGAVTALLFAPKPGRELRADLAEGCQAMSQKTQEIARNVSAHTSEFVGKAKQMAGQVAESVRNWNDPELLDDTVDETADGGKAVQ